jgi:hypothetical protein
MEESITKELRSVNAYALTEMLASGKWDGYRAVFMSTTLRGSIADHIDERFDRELRAKQDEIDGLKADIADLQARLDASIQPPVDIDGTRWTGYDVDKPFSPTDVGKAAEGLVREIVYDWPREGWWIVDQYDTHYPADRCRHVAPEPTDTIEDIERDASDVAPDAYRPRMIPYDELDGLSAEMAKSIDIARRAYEQGKLDGAGEQA